MRGSPPPPPPARNQRDRRDGPLVLQYIVFGAFFGTLIAIPWAPEHWWRLLITAAILLVVAAAISDARRRSR